MSQTTVLINGNIYGEYGCIQNGYLKYKNQTILGIGTMDTYQPENQCDVIDLKGKTVIPGMIDSHIHGAAGADVMDATTLALETIASALPAEGVTSFLATTMTQSDEAISNALRNTSMYIKEGQEKGKSEIIGIHLEGPFINPIRCGAQPKEHIMLPNVTLFKKWESLAEGYIKLVTLAPELNYGLELVQYLNQAGIVVSIGHSDATYSEVKKAIEAGATQVTHLYNQMRGLHHREPGVAGAALLLEELFAEIIADGIHVSPEMIDLTYRQKKSDRIILISDSIRAKYLKDGTYELGGQQVIVKGSRAELPNGTLAGSVLKLKDAIRNMLSYAKGCTLDDVIKMTSLNPAIRLDISDRKGSLMIGKDADIVVLDDEFDVEMTICGGQLAYQKEGAIRNGIN